MLGYALACRQHTYVSFRECLFSVFLALSIGTCLAGVYTFPFIAYMKLFDVRHLLSLPGYEFSHYFSYVRVDGLGKRGVVASLFWAVIVVLVAVRSIWRTRGNAILRVCALLTSGLGLLMLTPGLGLWFVNSSGLKPPVFKAGDYYPERLLAMALMTLALGLFAYSHISEKNVPAQDSRLLVLLITACGSFFLMLPWSAFLWRAVPLAATAIQFPYRVGILLTIAVAGLFAAAIDSCLCRQVGREISRSAVLVVFMAIMVVAGGVLTWRADWEWMHLLRNPPPVHADETHDVDHTYRIYVAWPHVPEFARLIGAGVDNRNASPPSIAAGAAKLVQGAGVVNLVRLSPRKLLISYDVSEEGMALIGLTYSPLWRIQTMTGSPANSTLSSSAEGLVELPLIPGRHDLMLVFDGGPPEKYGLFATYSALFVILTGILLEFALNRVSNKPRLLT